MSSAQVIKDRAYEFVNFIAEEAVKANPDATLVEIGGLAHSTIANVIRRESEKLYNESTKTSGSTEGSTGTQREPQQV